MIKNFVTRRVSKTTLVQQFRSQSPEIEDNHIFILYGNNTLDYSVLEGLVRLTYPEFNVSHTLNSASSKTIYVFTQKQANLEKLATHDIQTTAVFLCWKRKTRHKKQSLNWFSVSFPIKIKRLIFNKSDVFIALHTSLYESNEQLNAGFELNALTLNGITNKSTNEMLELLKSDPKLANHIANHPTDGKKVARYHREIAAKKNLRIVSKLTSTLDLIWKLTLEGMYVDQEGINRLRELGKREQIVYVPSHRSHVDYLLIGYIIYKYGLDTPVTAAGVNLSFFPLGPFFRRAGAYFIRRSFRGNPTYSLTFKAYLKQLMLSGGPQMFYIEGGRSRSGKLLSPKLGMLSMLVDYYKQGDVKDFYFAPLSVEYGKLFEGQSYKDELTGGEKQKESFFAMFDTLKYLKKKQGITYVQFAKPFSIHEFYQNMPVKDLSVKEYNQSIKRLGNTIIHRINSIVTVTPSAILSLVLLCNTRRGIHRQELLRSCKMIFNYLRLKGVRIAIQKDQFEEAFLNVLKTFEYNQYVKRVEFNNEIIYKPKNYSRYFLDYYKNNLIHLFLPMSFVAVSIRSSSEDSISIPLLLEEVEKLKAIFSHEFVYNDEIWSEKNLRETIKFFSIVKEISLAGDIIQRTNKRGNNWLEITYNILRNFLEGYYLATAELLSLSEPIIEKQFYQVLNAKAAQMFEVGEIQMIESNSKDIYQNVMNYCAEERWISKRGKKLEVLAAKRSEFRDFSERVASYLV